MIYVFSFLWLAGWILAYRFRQPLTVGKSGLPHHPSIIIPARNEAHNLPKLLESLKRQSVAPMEILVVDDGSSDGTAEIAATMGARVIPSQPLPSGWRGKTWACHQGALAAKSDWLMFLDADTWFEPGGLERVLDLKHPGALSIGPYHSVRCWYEDLSLFFNLCMTSGTVPDGLAGQCLLVNREDYQRAGGHESVHGRVLENFVFAQHLHDAGVPLRSLTGRGILSFRMYPGGFREMIEGWTKGFAAGAGGTRRGTLMLVVAWMIGLMIAPLAGFMSGDWNLWGIACGLCSIQVILIARKLGSFGWFPMLFYPIPLMFFFALFGWSALRSGRKVTWKGREIHAD